MASVEITRMSYTQLQWRLDDIQFELYQSDDPLSASQLRELSAIELMIEAEMMRRISECCDPSDCDPIDITYESVRGRRSKQEKRALTCQ